MKNYLFYNKINLILLFIINILKISKGSVTLTYYDTTSYLNPDFNVDNIPDGTFTENLITINPLGPPLTYMYGIAPTLNNAFTTTLIQNENTFFKWANSIDPQSTGTNNNYFAPGAFHSPLFRSQFYPVDNLGYGNDDSIDGHNHKWCAKVEMSVQLLTQGASFMYFIHSDDFFVYHNGQLVDGYIGITPIHQAYVIFNDHGLLNQLSTLTIITCNRKVRADQNFGIVYSNFPLDCENNQFDACGICRGDGSYCMCNGEPCVQSEVKCHVQKCFSNTSCSDSSDDCNTIHYHNQCVNKVCLQDEGCITESTCPLTGECNEKYCSTETGCISFTVPGCQLCVNSVNNNTERCIVNDRCSPRFCSQDGKCIEQPKVICNDNNKCTLDQCDPNTGTCSFTSIKTCNDNNPCTNDMCDPTTGKCIYIINPCNDNNRCTIDSCDSRTGSCINQPISCDDFNACTQNLCQSEMGCVFVPISCDDNNQCTRDLCDTSSGCIYEPLSCNDENICTIDSCDNSTGCSYSLESCDDNNLCTSDSCDPITGCKFTLISCNDNNICTTDTCNPSTGCSNTQITCNDNNVCTTDTCDPTIGCRNVEITCDDFNSCTQDMCDRVKGCVFIPTTCNDGNVCTLDSCDPVAGCSFNQIPNCVPCNNGTTPCITLNLCSVSTCINDSSCQLINTDCNDNNQCTTNICDSTTGSCLSTPIDCNDNNPCTIDSCDVVTGCSNTQILNCLPCGGTACITSNLCHPRKCIINTSFPSGTCVEDQPVVCNDNNACTFDICDPTNASCSFTPINCSDDSVCSEDLCDPSKGCSYVQIPNCMECEMGVQCLTTDLCNPKICLNGTCVENQVNCTPTSVCITGSCDSSNGQCNFTSISCNDNNDCTTDSCDPITGCSNIQIPNCADCIPGSQCITVDLCQPILCSVNTPDCINTTIVCPNGDPCAQSVCNSTDGKCYTTPISCDDNNGCTLDSCNFQTGCVNTLIENCVSCNNQPCVTTNKCFPNDCNDSGYCQSSPIICPDQDTDNCTVSLCDPLTGQCINSPVDCSHNNSCIDSVCNPLNGQCTDTVISCNDGNACSVDHCDISTGCINSPIINCIECNDSPCVSNNLCSPQKCNNNDTCILEPISCDDDNACTSQMCSSITGQCTTIPIICESDNDPCTDDFCDPIKGCVYINNASNCNTCDARTCISQDLCKISRCINNTCVTSPINCTSQTQCIFGQCNLITSHCDCNIQTETPSPTPTPSPTNVYDPCSFKKCPKGKRCFNFNNRAVCQKTDCLSCEDLDCPSQGLKCISSKVRRSDRCHDCCNYIVTCSN